MENFNETLKSAINRCNGKISWKRDSSKSFYKIYPFTTENISGYINEFELKNKSLLTVGSSGDQILNAVYKDCKDITLLDINPYTKYYFYLKMSCLLSLNLNEFLTFLRYRNYSETDDNKDVFSKLLFSKVGKTLQNLDNEAYFFWKTLFDNFEMVDIRKNLFSLDEGKTNVLKQENFYLQNNINYDETKDKLKHLNITFLHDNILNTEIQKTFDNIWLSNIAQYLKLKEVVVMINKMYSLLNMDGKMLISYLYEPDFDSSKQVIDWPDAYDMKKLLVNIRTCKPYLMKFIGVKGLMMQDNTIEDGALIYKKVK